MSSKSPKPVAGSLCALRVDFISHIWDFISHPSAGLCGWCIIFARLTGAVTPLPLRILLHQGESVSSPLLAPFQGVFAGQSDADSIQRARSRLVRMLKGQILNHPSLPCPRTMGGSNQSSHCL